MLTYKDCVDYSDLTEEEILAVEDCEHLPAMAACARGYGLATTPRGCRMLLKYLLDRLEHVEAKNDAKHVVELHRDLEQFAAKHHYL